MKRSELKRKTPLKSNSELKRSPSRKHRRSKQARGREFSPAIKAIVTERSGGLCEHCRRRPIASIHHCKFRSQLRRSEGSGGLKRALGLCIECDALVHGGTEGQKYRVMYAELAESLANVPDDAS